MEKYVDEGSTPESIQQPQLNIADASLEVAGNTIDVLGGRISPDFYDLAAAGFSEGELKDMLRLRRDYKQGTVNDLTKEHKRLQFARWLYRQGKMGS